jgi:dTDP-glucose 4,6-dehydratase
MKILVTGGAGFIGTNFIFYLRKYYSEHHIICLDKLTYAANLSNLSSLIEAGDLAFVKGDITDIEFLDDFFYLNDFDMVINFAAESHVDRSILGPRVFLYTNYIGVFNLLEQVRKNPNIRFHQVSTDEVFGDLPLDQPELSFTEISPFRPSSPYASSKAAADLLILSYHRTYNLNVTISHSSNNYGPYQFLEKLIPLVILNATKDKSIPVYGDGKNVRDWIHVYDHCSALAIILFRGKSGSTYNIGSDNEINNINIVTKILKIIGKSTSFITYVTDRPGHDLRYSVNSSKLRLDLGWKPVINFDDGLKDTVKWYLNNSQWVNEIVSGEYKEYYRQFYGEKID